MPIVENTIKFFERIIGFFKDKSQKARQLREMSYEELRKNAIRKGASVFGLNKYEKELFRREKEMRWLDEKIKETRQKKQGFFG